MSRPIPAAICTPWASSPTSCSPGRRRSPARRRCRSPTSTSRVACRTRAPVCRRSPPSSTGSWPARRTATARCGQSRPWRCAAISRTSRRPAARPRARLDRRPSARGGLAAAGRRDHRRGAAGRGDGRRRAGHDHPDDRAYRAHEAAAVAEAAGRPGARRRGRRDRLGCVDLPRPPPRRGPRRRRHPARPGARPTHRPRVLGPHHRRALLRAHRRGSCRACTPDPARRWNAARSSRSYRRWAPRPCAPRGSRAWPSNGPTPPWRAMAWTSR